MNFTCTIAFFVKLSSTCTNFKIHTTILGFPKVSMTIKKLPCQLKNNCEVSKIAIIKLIIFHFEAMEYCVSCIKSVNDWVQLNHQDTSVEGFPT